MGIIRNEEEGERWEKRERIVYNKCSEEDVERRERNEGEGVK